MSASERRANAARQYGQRLIASAMDGLKEALDTPNGRALVWYYYAENVDAEGAGSRGRRAIARDLMRAASLANWAGVQQMREDHERARAWAKADAGRAEAQDEEEQAEDE